MTAIPREPLVCCMCQTSLKGELDTFGDPGSEICADCWYDSPENNDSWYGQAPHHHDMALTGSWIGSTVYDPIPEPDASGVIALPNGTFFVPDAEVDGTAGVYYIRYPYDRDRVQ